MSAKFIVPTEDTTLKLRNGKEVILTKEEYYYTEDNPKIPVIKHYRLVEIAEESSVKVERTILEFGCFNSPYNFCFIHRSFGKLDGYEVDEIGEANPNNLLGDISTGYPAVMSNKRSQDRLLIRLLGLTGKVYSDVEYVEEKSKGQPQGPSQPSGAPTQGTGTAAPTSGSTAAPVNRQAPPSGGAAPRNPSGEAQAAGAGAGKEMTIEEAENLQVNFGTFEKNPVSLKDLKEKHKKDFDWLANTYKTGPRTSEHMKKLKIGAMLLKTAS